MNRPPSETIVAICCYKGDEHQVLNGLPYQMRHGCPLIFFSPEESRVLIPGHINHHVGKAAYIGQDSLDRQRNHLGILLTYPHSHFLLHDSDSYCLSKVIPREVYESSDTIWSNEVTEPRPHLSPLPKIAMQPPYFFSREVVQRMVNVAPSVIMHPITPYIDHYMLQLACVAGVQRRSFSELEHPALLDKGFHSDDPWEILRYRIRYNGTNFVHPIKTPEQIKLCYDAREFYEK